MDDECVETLGRPISSLKVTELRDELAKRALVKTGNKKELIDRLRLAIGRQAQEESQPQDHQSEEITQEEPAPLPTIAGHSPVGDLSESKDDEVLEEADYGEDGPEEVDKTEQDSALNLVAQGQVEEDQEPVQDVEDNNEAGNVHEEQTGSGEHIGQATHQVASVGGETEATSNQSEPIEHKHIEKTQIDNRTDANNQDQEKIKNLYQEVASTSAAPFTLKRGISDLKESSELNKNEKRRKWSAKNDSNEDDEQFQSKSASRGISSQKLQELIDIRASAETALPSEKGPSDVGSKKEARKVTDKEEEITIGKSDKDDDNNQTEIDLNEDKQVDEDEAINDKEREIEESRPNRDPTKGLCISHLVRPFTVPQLKSELTKFGSIIEDKFWINKVKSKCCVMFETIDIAQQTKEALDGQHWPVSNPKTLKIEYITEEEYDHHITFDEIRNDKEANGNSDRIKKSKTDKLASEGGDDVSSRKNSSKDGSSDVNTKSSQVNRNAENAQPQELDDLFMKTKCKPPLFWLPLTDDQAEVKQKERLERKTHEQEKRKLEKPVARRVSPQRRRSPQRRSPPRRRRHRSPRRSPVRHHSPIGRRPSPRRRSPFRKSPRRMSPESTRRSPRMLRRSPMLNRRSPAVTRRSPAGRSPDQPRRSPGSMRRSPGITRRSPGPMRRSPRPIRRSPGLMRRSPGPIRRSPGPLRRSPGPIRRSPVLMRRSPGPIRRSPGPIRRSPGPIRRSPGPIRRSPGPVRRSSPGPIRRSPGPIRRSPGPIRRSPGPVRRSSPGPIRRSPGPIRRSPGPIRRSPGPIRRSPGPIRRSPMLMRRSPPPIRGASPMLRRSRSRSRSPIRRRSPVRRRSPPRNLSPGQGLDYTNEPRRPDRFDRSRF